LNKAFWLLFPLLLLVGCGALSSKAIQQSIPPPPAHPSSQLSFLPPNWSEAGPLFPSGNGVEIKIAGHAGDPVKSESAADFCYQGEYEPLILAGGEEGSFSHPSNFDSLLFSASEEDSPTPGAQVLLSGMTIYPPEAKSGAMIVDGPSSTSLEEEADENNAAQPENLAEETPEGSLASSTPFAPGILAELQDWTPEFLSSLGKEIIPSSPPSAELCAAETPGESPSASDILTGVPILLNDKVKEFIDFFKTKAEAFFSASLARSQAYEGMMKKILREKDLPEELFYLALIESGYNPYAQSRSKASGIWQFMAKTARRFGLKVDKWVDERRDPEKSTYAAAEYLKNLYEMFNCWYLAAASYNAGEGKILQAIKRTHSQDFWEIAKHRYLKRETKEYVPMFLAARIIAQSPEKYGFSHIDYRPPLVYEKVAVPPGTRLVRIAKAAKTDIEVLRTLNPSLKRDKTPPNGSLFEIKLPPGKKEVFQNTFFKGCKSDPRNPKTHVVRPGETLGHIAKKHRVSLQELCECNQISAKAIIRPGETLLVPP
jgi:LysM repeat protein